MIVALLTPVYDCVELGAASGREELISRWRELAPADWWLKPIYMRGSPVDAIRNGLVVTALQDFGNGHPPMPESTLGYGPADVLLWCDSDCCLDTSEDYVELVRSLVDKCDPDVAAVGVALPIQTVEGRPSVNVSVVGMQDRFRNGIQANSGLVEVAGIGFGIIATRANCYSGAGPWFQFIQRPNAGRMAPGSHAATAHGEDMLWCDDMRKANRRVLLHTGLMGRHNFRKSFRLVPDLRWEPLYS